MCVCSVLKSVSNAMCAIPGFDVYVLAAFLTTMYARQTLVATYCCKLWFLLDDLNKHMKKVVVFNPRRARSLRMESTKIKEKLREWRRKLDNARCSQTDMHEEKVSPLFPHTFLDLPYLWLETSSQPITLY